MKQGVSLLDPENTYIESSVKNGPDTAIGPFTLIAGRTRIAPAVWCLPRLSSKMLCLDDGVSVPPFSHIKDQRVTAQKSAFPSLKFKVLESGMCGIIGYLGLRTR